MLQKCQLILSIISTYKYQDISDSFAHFESVLSISLWRTDFETSHVCIIFGLKENAANLARVSCSQNKGTGCSSEWIL